MSTAALGADERPIRVGDVVQHGHPKRSDVRGRVIRTDDKGQAEVESHPGTWWNAHNLCRLDCSCGIIKVGGEPTASRNWSPDCVEHGTGSDWYNSDDQIAKRRADSSRLRDLQLRAREARAAAK